ncbi:hypothetical protein MMC30_002034 [Trapelia coarctata]|nr:hypothetical protein [Trapelia coarctata]
MDRAIQHLTRLSSFERARRPRPSKSTDSLSTVRSSLDASLPHIDALPNTPDGLEGRLNHLASQLQIMADRVDKVNEMIDMENIVLLRLAREQKEALKKQGEGGGVGFEEGRHGMDTGRAREEEEDEEVPLVTNEMRNKQTLVTEMKRLKKGMEKSVVWQRDEYWRVERAMGRRGSGRKEVDDGEGSVKGRHRGSLPTQEEWEVKFS